MNWKTSYNEDLAVVFEDAKAIVSVFPKPLAALGLAYVDQYNPLLPDSTKNYICYLLPFWLQDVTGTDSAASRKLSLANVFIMLYFFVQDDLMDTSPDDWKEQLALGNLLYVAFLDIYRETFPPDSPFWHFFSRYIGEWAVAVATEGQASYSDYSLAMKASPVKLASTGALLLSGRETLIPAVSDAVDSVLTTLQMADDWADWENDLMEGSGNSLLSFIRKERQLPEDSPLTALEVKQAVGINGVLGRFAKTAAQRHEYLRQGSFDAPMLFAFHQSLVSQLEKSGESLSERSRSLLRGGFVDWLSKSSNMTYAARPE
ncbi:hypothetical protein [Paenibacillus nasutitermitis]|nr:hypothetical protein [Paenibacillus nasutitermitis]